MGIVKWDYKPTGKQNFSKTSYLHNLKCFFYNKKPLVLWFWDCTAYRTGNCKMKTDCIACIDCIYISMMYCEFGLYNL